MPTFAHARHAARARFLFRHFAWPFARKMTPNYHAYGRVTRKWPFFETFTGLEQFLGLECVFVTLLISAVNDGDCDM